MLKPDEAPEVVYRRRLNEDKAVYFQSCGQCDFVIFPPRVLCPNCGGSELRWEQSAGSGSVYSTSTVYRRDEDPYDVSIVDVDEGFRMMSSIRGIAPNEVVIGMRVQLETVSDERGVVPYFRGMK